MKLARVLDRDWREQVLCTRGLHAGGVAAKAGLFGRAAAALQDMGVDVGSPAQACFVPGRIEVLGKHTDYAGGHTIVNAVEQGFCMVASPREDATVRLRAVAGGETVEFAMHPELRAAHGHWSNYPMTVARRLARNFGAARKGADAAFISDLPPASGMSSSSAMMIATYLVLARINQLDQTLEHRQVIDSPLALAAYLGTVENGQTFGSLLGDQGVGTFGGSEDHTAILCSQPGRLGQFGYCPARFERYIPMPSGCVFALAFSGVVAEKTGAAQDQYNRASRLVQTMVKIWRQHTGGAEVYLEEILAAEPSRSDQLRNLLANTTMDGFSPDELVQRFDHYMEENHHIVGPAGDALADGDLATFGKLVDRSQELTDTLLGNQVEETVALARMARELGAHAASAFGAGFGGSVWAMIDGEKADDFLTVWSERYRDAFPAAASRARFFTTQAAPAAFALE